MAEKMPYIELRNVIFAYGERRIIDGISISIQQGQIIAIMGGSGSGKTTLLRLISGQIKASSGQVLINGQDIALMRGNELTQHRRRMGMLFQFGALFTDLSVFENVAFPLNEHTKLGPSLIRSLVLMKLNAVGLLGTQNLLPSELSGGMARRVALARAIALDPELMLYDEPFTGLDPISLGVIAHLIKRLNDALGTSTIMVTHDILKSLEIVDYVYLVADGKISAEGSAEEIKLSNSALVKQFIHGEAYGPVKYAYPAKKSLAEEIGLEIKNHV